ncbi:MAG: hypothetical protein IJK44_04875 [Bacteroidales bacterium]|nr:hypothetical protein [Bacteroidales bacterium]
MKKLWLVTTNHLEDGLWFRDDEDFKVGMTHVAIGAQGGVVIVLAFILMSNHVHFVLYGTRKEVEDFMVALKQRYSLYLSKKYGERDFLRRNHVDYKLIPSDDEALEWAIAYVQMNCVAANICSHPSQYPWGTGNVFFNASKSMGRSIGSMSGRECKRLLHTSSKNLPEEWVVSDDGYILPENYVAVKTVESCYRHAKRMNYFLRNSSKARRRMDTADDKLPSFRDQTILAALPDLCQSMFGKEAFGVLTPSEQIEFVHQVRFRFSANVNQVARVCGISYEQAARLMDSA